MKKRKENIVFIINPSQWYQNMYPSGILCLSGYLKLKGFDNIILDSKISPKKIRKDKRGGAVLNEIEKIQPRIVCFSSTHREFDEVVRMNKEITKVNKNVITIVGGSQPTYRATDYLENGFKFACRGEGEQTLYEFVKEVFNKSYRWEKIKGLCWKSKKGNVFNQPRQLMNEAEINGVTVPPYDKIDKRYFDFSIGTIRGLPIKGALLLTTRGCPFSCSYCGCNLIFGRKLRFKSIKNIEKEVKYLKDKYDIEGIWIVDDTFTINENHVFKVSQVLRQYGLIWGCQSRVDTINEKVIRVMKQSGCVQIDFGVESGSQRILDDIIGKKTNIKQTFNAFNLAKKFGIRTFANFMIGLPTETYGDLGKTEKIADLIGADVYIFSIATPLPGTRLYEMIKREIGPHEYSLLDWNGGDLTEKLNRSKIKNLIKEKRRLYRKYFLRTKAKALFSIDYYRFFLRMPHRFQRLKSIANFYLNHTTQ